MPCKLEAGGSKGSRQKRNADDQIWDTQEHDYHKICDNQREQIKLHRGNTEEFTPVPPMRESLTETKLCEYTVSNSVELCETKNHKSLNINT